MGDGRLFWHVLPRDRELHKSQVHAARCLASSTSTFLAARLQFLFPPPLQVADLGISTASFKITAAGVARLDLECWRCARNVGMFN